MAKLKALPTAKRKEGNTKSVGVKPFQSACLSGQKTAAQLPGVLTMIMKQTVSPRNTSKAMKREEDMFNSEFIMLI